MRRLEKTEFQGVLSSVKNKKKKKELTTLQVVVVESLLSSSSFLVLLNLQLHFYNLMKT